MSRVVSRRAGWELASVAPVIRLVSRASAGAWSGTGPERGLPGGRDGEQREGDMDSTVCWREDGQKMDRDAMPGAWQ